MSSQSSGDIQNQSVKPKNVQQQDNNKEQSSLPTQSDFREQAPQLRRSTRQKKPPSKLDDYELFLSDQSKPTTFKQACKDQNSMKWMEAMHEEISSL